MEPQPITAQPFRQVDQQRMGSVAVGAIAADCASVDRRPGQPTHEGKPAMTTTTDHRKLADDCRMLERIYRRQGRLEMAHAAHLRRIWHQQQAKQQNHD
jgi:hypothetical protein